MPKLSDSAPQAPTVRALLGQAAEAQRAGNRALATDTLVQAKALAATTGETLPRSLAYDLGVLLFEQRRFEEALAEVQQGLARLPGTFALNNLGGILLKNLGRYPEAVTLLEAASKAEPGNIAPLVNLANTHLMTGDAARAVAVTERLCRQEGRIGEHHRLLGAARRIPGRRLRPPRIAVGAAAAPRRRSG